MTTVDHVEVVNVEQPFAPTASGLSTVLVPTNETTLCDVGSGTADHVIGEFLAATALAQTIIGTYQYSPC